MTGENTPEETPSSNLCPPWQPGQSGNPAGRPKGSRNKLSEAFFKALADDFETAAAEDKSLGALAIATMRAEKPNEYAKMIATLMAKEVEGDVSVNLVGRIVYPGLDD